MKFLLLLLLMLSTAKILAQDLPYDVTPVTEEKEINLVHPDFDHHLRGIKYKDVIYYIDNSLEKITAFKVDGSIKWQVNMNDVFKCPHIGESGIWRIIICKQLISGDVSRIKNEELFIVYARHDFAKINLETGVAEYLGAD